MAHSSEGIGTPASMLDQSWPRSDDDPDASDKRQVSFADPKVAESGGGDLGTGDSKKVTRTLVIAAFTNKFTPESIVAMAWVKLKALVVKRRAAKRREAIKNENVIAGEVAATLEEVQEDVSRTLVMRQASMRSSMRSSLRGSLSQLNPDDSPGEGEGEGDDIEQLRRDLEERENRISRIVDMGRRLEKSYRERGEQIQDLQDERDEAIQRAEDLERQSYVLQQELRKERKSNKELRTDMMMVSQVQEDYVRLQQVVEERDKRIEQLEGRVQDERNDAWAANMLNKALKRSKDEEKKLEEEKKNLDERAERAHEEIEEKAAQAAQEKIVKANKMKDMAIMAFKASQNETFERREKEHLKDLEEKERELEAAVLQSAEQERSMETLKQKVKEVQEELIQKTEEFSEVQHKLKQEGAKHLEERVAELQALIEEKDQECARTRGDLDEWKRLSDDHENISLELKNENDKLQASVERLQKEVEKSHEVADQKVQAAAERERVVNETATDLQHRLSASEAKVRDTQRKHAEVESSLKDEAVGLVKQLDSAKREIATLRDEVATHASRAPVLEAEAESARKALQEEVQASKNLYQSASADLQSLRHQHAALKSELEHETKKVKDSAQAAETLARDLQNTSETAAQQRAQLEEQVRAAEASLRGDADRMDAEVKRLQRELVDERKRTKDVEQSHAQAASKWKELLEDARAQSQRDLSDVEAEQKRAVRVAEEKLTASNAELDRARKELSDANLRMSQAKEAAARTEQQLRDEAHRLEAEAHDASRRDADREMQRKESQLASERDQAQDEVRKLRVLLEEAKAGSRSADKVKSALSSLQHDHEAAVDSLKKEFQRLLDEQASEAQRVSRDLQDAKHRSDDTQKQLDLVQRESKRREALDAEKHEAAQRSLNETDNQLREAERQVKALKDEAAANERTVKAEIGGHEQRCRAAERQRDEAARSHTEELQRREMEMAAQRERHEQLREDLRAKEERLADVLRDADSQKSSAADRLAQAKRDGEAQGQEARHLTEQLGRERLRATELEEEVRLLRDNVQHEKANAQSARSAEADALVQVKEAQHMASDRGTSIRTLDQQHQRAERQLEEAKHALREAEARIDRQEQQHGDTVHALREELQQARGNIEATARDGRKHVEDVQQCLDDARAELRRREQEHLGAVSQLSHEVREAESRAQQSEADLRVSEVEGKELHASVHHLQEQLGTASQQVQAMRSELASSEDVRAILQRELATAKEDRRRAIEGSEGVRHEVDAVRAAKDEVLDASVRRRQREVGLAQQEAVDAKRECEALASKVHTLDRRYTDAVAAHSEAMASEAATTKHWHTMAEGLRVDLAGMEEELRRQQNSATLAREELQRERERVRAAEAKSGEAAANEARLEGEIEQLIDAQRRVAESAVVARSGVEDAMQKNIREHDAVCAELDVQKEKAAGLQQRADDAEAECRRLRNEVHAAKQALAARAETSEDADTQLERAYEALSQAKASTEALRQSEADHHRRATGFERDAHVAQEGLAESKRHESLARKELEAARRELSATEERMRVLETETQSLRSQLGASEEGNARSAASASGAQLRLDDTEARLQAAQKELAEERRCVASLSTQLAVTHDEMESCKTRLSAAQQDSQHATAELHAAQRENSVLSERALSPERLSSADDTRAAAAERQLKATREDLSASRSETTRLRRDVEGLKLKHAREMQGKDALTGQLEQRIHALQLQLERADEKGAEATALAAELAKQKKLAGEQAARHDAVHTEVLGLRRSVARAEEEARHQVEAMQLRMASAEELSQQRMRELQDSSEQNARLAVRRSHAVAEAEERHQQLLRECGTMRERCTALECSQDMSASELASLRADLREAEAESRTAQTRLGLARSAAREAEARAATEGESRAAAEQELARASDFSPSVRGSPTRVFYSPPRLAEDALRRDLKGAEKRNMELESRLSVLRRSASPASPDFEEQREGSQVLRKLRDVTSHVDVCSSPVRDVLSKYTASASPDSQFQSRLTAAGLKVNGVSVTLSSLPHGSPLSPPRSTYRPMTPFSVDTDVDAMFRPDAGSGASSPHSPAALATPPSVAATPTPASPLGVEAGLVLSSQEHTSIALTLYKAMKGFGTDEDGVYGELQKISVQGDWSAVQDAFRRDHPQFNKGDLRLAIKDELTARELATAQGILIDRGIAW